MRHVDKLAAKRTAAAVCGCRETAGQLSLVFNSPVLRILQLATVSLFMTKIFNLAS